MGLSQRAKSMSISPIRTAIASKPPTVRVYHLNIGQPDLPSPQEFFDGIKTFSSPTLAYDSAKGNSDLLTAWTYHLNQQYNLSLTSHDMLITSGSSEALAFVFNICCDVNDEILVFSPTYANYTGFATMSGVKLVPVPCSFDDNFHLPQNPDHITQHITPQTKAILLCNPNNPTGTVYTRAEIESLLDICDAHDLYLIVDEVYREFVYNTTPFTALEIPKHSDRIIVVDSISKRYSLCGARIGCLITKNQEFMAAAANFASTRVSAPTIEQLATTHMLKTLSPTYLTNAIQEYKSRRDLLLSHLQTIPNLKTNTPEGGFYILTQLPVQDSKVFAHQLEHQFSINQETVSIAPAHGFYINSKQSTNYARIAFVLDKPSLITCVNILAEALKTL